MKKLAAALATLVMLTGCIAPKTYVNPNFSHAKYSDINEVQSKYDTLVEVEFQRNGDPLPAVDSEVRSHVERTLRASGVIVPTTEETTFTIKVIVNNIADMTEAGAKGFGTGLTFGAIGTTVVDYYQIDIVYSDKDGKNIEKSYKHALHTTIGNEDAPFENALPTTPADGFGTVVEQVLLNYIAGMQKDGKLTKFKHRTQINMA